MAGPPLQGQNGRQVDVYPVLWVDLPHFWREQAKKFFFTPIFGKVFFYNKKFFFRNVICCFFFCEFTTKRPKKKNSTELIQWPAK